MNRSKNLKHLYVKRRTGIIVPINVYTGNEPFRETSSAEVTAVALNPDLVITEEELEKNVSTIGITNYKKFYKPIVDTLRNHGPLTLNQLKEFTGRSKIEDKEYLIQLRNGGLVNYDGSVYKINDENLEAIMQTFGIVL
jgi:hypothetical protein